MNQLEKRILEISYKHKLSHLSSNLSSVNIIDEIYSIKKENERAYRDQTIIIYDTENEKTIRQKKVKVPYAEKIDGKWVYLNPPRVIWLDQNGNEIKRK